MIFSSFRWPQECITSATKQKLLVYFTCPLSTFEKILDHASTCWWSDDDSLEIEVDLQINVSKLHDEKNKFIKLSA